MSYGYFFMNQNFSRNLRSKIENSHFSKNENHRKIRNSRKTSCVSLQTQEYNAKHFPNSYFSHLEEVAQTNTLLKRIASSPPYPYKSATSKAPRPTINLHRSPREIPFLKPRIILILHRIISDVQVKRSGAGVHLKLETAPTPRRRPQNDQFKAGVFLAHTTTKSGRKTVLRLPAFTANMTRAGAGGSESSERPNGTRQQLGGTGKVEFE